MGIPQPNIQFDGYLDGTLAETLAEHTEAYLKANIDSMSAEEARGSRLSAAAAGDHGRQGCET